MVLVLEARGIMACCPFQVQQCRAEPHPLDPYQCEVQHPTILRGGWPQVLKYSKIWVVVNIMVFICVLSIVGTKKGTAILTTTHMKYS